MKESWRECLGALKKRAAGWLGTEDDVTRGLKLVAGYLRSGLGRCPACGGDFTDHSFVRFAMTLYVIENERRCNDFLAALREQRWRDALQFREFDPLNDALVAHAVRCPGRRLVWVVMHEPYNFADLPSIFEMRVLDAQSSAELESLIERDPWVPLA